MDGKGKICLKKASKVKCGTIDRESCTTWCHLTERRMSANQKCVFESEANKGCLK